LPLQLRPPKTGRSARVLGQLAPLATLHIGVEDKAALIDILQQHHARGWLQVLSCGGQSERIMRLDVELLGLGQQFSKPDDGLSIHSGSLVMFQMIRHQ
jgi:hypothetical protein